MNITSSIDRRHCMSYLPLQSYERGEMRLPLGRSPRVMLTRSFLLLEYPFDVA